MLNFRYAKVVRYAKNDWSTPILFEIQKGKCGLTNLPMDLKNDNIHIDHKIPIARGEMAMGEITNLQLAHGIASLIKGDRLECELTFDDWREMYLKADANRWENCFG